MRDHLSAARVAQIALVVASAVTIDRFARVVARGFVLAQGGRARLDSSAVFWLSLWYTVPVLTILGAHELGHWATARRRGARTAGIWLLPLPISWVAALGLPIPMFGTLGAYCPVTADAPRDRWAIAAAGPVAGGLVTLVWLGVGLALSGPGQGPSAYMPTWLAGLGRDLTWHPALYAGWFGVLVTGLNVLPVPGFDGWTLLTTWEDVTPREHWATAMLGILACACLISF